jgi:hypothetical protein
MILCTVIAFGNESAFATKIGKSARSATQYDDLLVFTDIPQVACGLTSRSPDFAL